MSSCVIIGKFFIILKMILILLDKARNCMENVRNLQLVELTSKFSAFPYNLVKSQFFITYQHKSIASFHLQRFLVFFHSIDRPISL